jgi:hypothetical protein
VTNLTERELNRAMLARQLLLERSDLSIPGALEQIAGIQNQYAPNAYIRLRSCLEHFERQDLTNALKQRTIVQGTLMRSTIHLVSAGDYWPLALAVRRARREWWLRLQKGTRSDRQMEKHASEVRLTLDGASFSAEQLKRLSKGYVDLWLDMIRVPPSGTWERRRANMYVFADSWLGETRIGEAKALQQIVRRYLGGFGPASLQDIASWTGIPADDLAPAMRHLKLTRFRSESGAELFDLPSAPRPDANTPAPVRLLPAFDATLLVHARRTGILPEQYRKIVFHVKNPQSMPTFLVDGRVCGAWKEESGRILFKPFEAISRKVRLQLEEEGMRMLALWQEASLGN